MEPQEEKFVAQEEVDFFCYIRMIKKSYLTY